MADRTHVRLAELVAALSLGVDLGFGQPMEHVLRQCLIALRLADRLDLPERERVAVYYTALLVNVGCHTDAHEQAKWFGDDIALKAGKYDHEMRGLRGALATLRMVGAGNPPRQRVRVGLEFALSGRRVFDDMISHHAAMACALAAQLELPAQVGDALGAAYEQWDGRGWPGERAGEAIPTAARLAQLAEFTEVAHRVGGVAAARDLARRRAGKQFDPALAALVREDADAILAGLDGVANWDAVIDAEPALAVVLSGERIDEALLAIAGFVDLKTPFALGHARAVAELAAAGAARAGLPEAEARTLRRAALVHDLGRLGVSNSIWDKPGPLGPGEWERVRLQPYLTERMLSQSGSLAPLGAIAVQHHERLDGSGYPRGLSGGAISAPARVLAAADAYQAMCEPRPYRPPHPPPVAAGELRADVRAGRLDGEAVEAVLGAAGHRVPRRREGPEGLTAREIEVLRLVARGMSNREIGERLVISPKTVGNHVEHIYAKIGASTRATASLFALRHGLLPEEQVAG
ncbi:MAG TPA: HD domain-containing phosphohydrolase [Solirubrobacteraceae bacterium]|nr:HD domain-containing phosphohydrolase [Solirubrobacteraceae bacterium]